MLTSPGGDPLQPSAAVIGMVGRTAEDVERRLHWLEAAARWISFAREEGHLPPRQGRSAGFCRPSPSPNLRSP